MRIETFSQSVLGTSASRKLHSGRVVLQMMCA